MSRVFFFFLVPLQLLLGQSKDVSNTIRGQFTDNPSYNSSLGSQTKFIGAALDNNDILHITLMLDESYVGMSRLVMKTFGNAFGIDYKPNDIRYEIALESIFLTSRKIFKKVTQASEIRVYFATFDTTRDNYGNNKGVNKNIICYMALTRDKVQKLNWSHIVKLLNDTKLHQDELLNYLDKYEFDSKQFR